ncbi:dihydrodipicolinate synthase family protein [Amycolatopsis sp. OK19-0408]|uniref:Dihydrodipicolinate synthase family protein n=1 Tax=Amycolatopsis iheyensis TaxID=2945988 RepID=A0A9X2SPS8_9PSEU|nr:dihydrodipicolinate synthase family protein [Amycolatopsis iheyensis]MCR6490507.1 dihydrodipicolinate synthase family protein [Amycolatopsis iheyensis]
MLALPVPGGRLVNWSPAGPPCPAPPATAPTSRIAYAAAHVVADALADETGAVDWDATLAFREHLWSCGLGVAEAMDTAQRGAGLDWATTKTLVARTGALADGRRWCAGVGTDQLPPGPATAASIVDAWRAQLDLVGGAGAVPVVMASRALAAAATSPGDYHTAYGKLLSEASGPVLLHWLGEQFDPALAGYWGHHDVRGAARELAKLCAEHADVIAGVKVSVLDAEVETEFRRALPAGVACYTGDDFHYPELIAGDDHGHSEALLGVFDPLAPVAAAALARLDDGDPAGFRARLDPTVPLAREIFRAPTRHYKTGVVFLAYLNGHQNHFRMIAGSESARTITHLATLLRLADEAGVLADPDLALARMRPLLQAAGVV